MSDELKKCNCGKQPIVKEVAFTGYIVKCECGAQTFPVSHNRGFAIEKWNKKVSE